MKAQMVALLDALLKPRGLHSQALPKKTADLQKTCVAPVYAMPGRGRTSHLFQSPKGGAAQSSKKRPAMCPGSTSRSFGRGRAHI